MKTIPITVDNLDIVGEYLRRLWRESSYAEQPSIWSLDMPGAVRLAKKLMRRSEGPFGYALTSGGDIVGVAWGLLTVRLEDPGKKAFDCIVFCAEPGHGPLLLKLVEESLPRGTRLVIHVQSKNSERFRSFAERYSYTEVETLFAKAV